MNKYLLAFSYSINSQLQHKGQIIGKVILYLIIMVIFSQVFTSVQTTKTESSIRIWYTCTTYLVNLSCVPLAMQIQTDFAKNQFEHFLLKPVAYSWLRFSESLGSSLIHYMCLWLCTILIYPVLTNSYFLQLTSLLLGTCFGILSISLYLLLTMIIGLLTFWLKDIKNLYFTNLTATFCFGGLVVPLEFYPSTFKNICFYTPYPWILWAPASITTGELSFIHGLGYLFCWGLILLLGITVLHQKIIDKYTKQGF